MTDATKRIPLTVFESHSVGFVIVVPHKWIKGSKLHPSHTKLLRGVAFKATYVRSHKGYAEQAKMQHHYEKIVQRQLFIFKLKSVYLHQFIENFIQMFIEMHSYDL